MNAQHIFYAEDDADDAEFFADAVEAMGHRVKIFNNGISLVEALCNTLDKPDLIFLDVHESYFKYCELSARHDSPYYKL